MEDARVRAETVGRKRLGGWPTLWPTLYDESPQMRVPNPFCVLCKKGWPGLPMYASVCGYPATWSPLAPVPSLLIHSSDNRCFHRTGSRQSPLHVQAKAHRQKLSSEKTRPRSAAPANFSTAQDESQRWVHPFGKGRGKGWAPSFILRLAYTVRRKGRPPAPYQPHEPSATYRRFHDQNPVLPSSCRAEVSVACMRSRPVRPLFRQDPKE